MTTLFFSEMPSHTSYATKKKFYKYSQEDLINAIHAVRSGRLKIREAEREFHVPHSTIINKLKERTNLVRKIGPNPIISSNDEAIIEQFLISSARKGFPVSKRRLLLLAKEVAQKKMGRKWFTLFMRRHQNISLRHAETINAARACVTETSIKVRLLYLLN